jgi:hypothetical protein
MKIEGIIWLRDIADKLEFKHNCCFANYFDLNFLIKLMFADYFKGGLGRLAFVFLRSVP